MTCTSKRIIRVFPRRTQATPDDKLVFIGDPPFNIPDADEVHVSCTFTWDIGQAKRLQRLWSAFYPTKLGGPAFGDVGDEFVPGRYLKQGYVITSRGCPKHCRHCLVSKREGKLKTLQIQQGFNILDNNILACPRDHVEAVLDMLESQDKAVKFTGGLDVFLMKDWFIARLLKLRLDIAYIAYDQSKQRPVIERVVKKILDKAGWVDGTARRKLGCYVLIGQDGDSFEAAKGRLDWVTDQRILAYPMYYQPPGGEFRRPSKAWRALIRSYLRPWIRYSKGYRDELVEEQKVPLGFMELMGDVQPA